MPWIKLAFFELEERKWLLKVICWKDKNVWKDGEFKSRIYALDVKLEVGSI